MILKLFFIILINFSFLYGYESEDKLQVVIIGKVSKFIKWQDKENDKFTITVLDNPYGDLFNTIFDDKKIKKKEIDIIYIDSINKLSDSDVLYIPNSQAKTLPEILEKIKNKNILTVSNIRGFAEKGGIIQIYFVSQKVKLKINLDVANEEKLKISSSLLRIAKIVKEEK